MAVAVYIPTRIRVDAAALHERQSTIDEALAAAVGRALGNSQEVVRTRHTGATEVHPPDVHWSGDGLGDVSPEVLAEVEESIDRTVADSARTTGVTTPVAPAAGRHRRRQRPWFVRNAVNFHCRVGDFLTYRDQLAGAGPSGVLDVYFDMLDEVRWVSAWMVQVNQPYRVGDLGEEVGQRAIELQGLAYDKFLFWFFGTNERHRQRLISIDRDRVLEAALPDMRTRQFGRVHGDGEDAILWPRGWMLFADMVLPSIQQADVAAFGGELQVPMSVRDLDFIVHAESFERLFHVSWEDYVAEIGDQAASLRILPVHPMRRVHYRTLSHFVYNDVASRVAGTAAYFGRLTLLNQETLDWLPDTARSVANGLSDDVTRNVSPDRRTGSWEFGWTGAYIYTVLEPTEAQLNEARYRPRARILAPQLVEWLNRSQRYPWEFDFLRVMETTPHGIGFEFLLEELESLGAFDRLFESVEDAEYWVLHMLLIRRARGTRYATHARVQQCIALLNARRVEGLRHKHVVTRRVEGLGHKHVVAGGVEEIWLDKRSDAIVRVGAANDRDVVGEVWPRYLHEEDKVRIKPSRLPQFEKLLFKETRSLISDILSGDDQNTYNQEGFGLAAMERTVTRIGLEEFEEHYVEEVTFQLSARLLEVRRLDPAFEMYEVTFELVKRFPGGVWETVPNSRTTLPDGEFEGMLDWWPRLRGFAFIQAMAKVVAFGAVAIIAVEIGAVAFLIELAGGTAVVVLSIGIAEVIYLVTADHLTVEGFLLAALNGYLFALGFRFAGLAGRSLAARISINTSSVPRLFAGWFAERMVVGTLGGAGSAAMITFSHDIVNIALGRSNSFSSPEQYIRHMAIGVVAGVVFEFGAAPLQPLLRVVGRSGLESLANAGQRLQVVVQHIRDLGFSMPRWSALSVESLSGLRQRLHQLFEPGVANRMHAAFRERIAQISQALSETFGAEGRQVIWTSTIARRVLELSEINLTRGASSGLEKMLRSSIRYLDDEMVLSLSNNLRANEARAVRFLEDMGLLNESVIEQVARSRHLETLANAPELIGPIHYDPVISTLIREAAELSTAGAQARVGGLLRIVGTRPRVPETVVRGVEFDRGGTTAVYTVEGQTGLALKPGGGRTSREAVALVEMELLGIRTVYAAARQTGRRTQIVMRRIDGVSSKDIIGRLRQRRPLSEAEHVEIITQRTIDDLDRILTILEENQANIGDFQFIVRRSDGAVFVNDPVSFVVGGGPSGVLRDIIDRFHSLLRRAQEGAGR